MFYGISKLDAVATFVTAVVLGSSAFRSVAQDASSRPAHQESVQAAVESTYKAYLRAWKEKDCPSLNRLLSDDYQAVNFRGIVSTKANEITAAEEDRNYETLNGNVMSLNVFADSAIASGLIEASWKDEQGKMQQITLRFLAMLQKQKGEWKLVATQSTRFTQIVDKALEPARSSGPLHTLVRRRTRRRVNIGSEVAVQPFAKLQARAA